MRRIRHLLASALITSTLAACVVQQPAPAPGPSPQQIAEQRLHQVDGRLNNLGRRVDARVNQGYYPPPQGAALHRQLESIRHEAHDMAAQRGGGLTGDEARILNQQMDQAAGAIGQ